MINKVKQILSDIKHRVIVCRQFYSVRADKRVILLATPTHGNLGDQAIVFSEYQMVKRMFPDHKIIEVKNSYYLRFPDCLEGLIAPNDIIIIDGGGNLGTLWPNEDDKIADIINRFKHNRIIVFPQTCYYDMGYEAELRLKKNNEIYCSAQELTVMLRDRRSFAFFCEHFKDVKCYFVPDIVLSLNLDFLSRKRSGALLCFRGDCERVLGQNAKGEIQRILGEMNIAYAETSMIVSRYVDKKSRETELMKKWEEFASAQLVITDRLHAMIFAVLTHTPCIAFDNKSNKVYGTYENIRALDYIRFVEKTTNISEDITQLISATSTMSYEYPVNDIAEALKGLD